MPNYVINKIQSMCSDSSDIYAEDNDGAILGLKENDDLLALRYETQTPT
jgi:hypothetical protein